MSTRFFVVAAALLALSGCVGMHTGRPLNTAQISQIHPGLTEQAVRNLMGNPERTTLRPEANETVWWYLYTKVSYLAPVPLYFGASQKRDQITVIFKGGRVESCVREVSSVESHGSIFGAGATGPQSQQTYCDGRQS